MPASDYFYYIDTTGYCSNGDFVLATGWKEDSSKVCAWKPSLLNVVYGCDGDNGIAWTSPSACDNSPSTGNVSMAVSNQVSHSFASTTIWMINLWGNFRSSWVRLLQVRVAY